MAWKGLISTKQIAMVRFYSSNVKFININICWGSIFHLYASNVPVIGEPGNSFVMAKCVKSTSG